jgi:carbamoylphosphate synthase large subunit
MNKKKILVASKKETYEIQDLVTAAKRESVPLEVVDILDVASSSQKLKEADILYWRSGNVTSAFPGKTGRSTALLGANRLEYIVNRSVVTAPHYIYKSVQQALFKQFVGCFSNIRPIETFLVKNQEELKTLIVTEKLTFPFIAKPNLGKQGVGVKLIKSEKDLISVSADITSTVFQNFIKNNGDYRVLVVGGVAHDIMLRTAQKKSGDVFVNNISQGGKAQLVKDAGLRERLAKAGCAIAAMFDYTICGVDLIEDENETLYFLEVNSVPEWKGLNSVSSHNVGEHIVETLIAISNKDTATQIFSPRNKVPFSFTTPPHIRGTVLQKRT